MERKTGEMELVKKSWVKKGVNVRERVNDEMRRKMG